MKLCSYRWAAWSQRSIQKSWEIHSKYILVIKCSSCCSCSCMVLRFYRAFNLVKLCCLPAVIFTPKRHQVFFTGRECDWFNLGVVDPQLDMDCSLCIIPDNHWSLEKSKTGIEGHRKCYTVQRLVSVATWKPIKLTCPEAMYDPLLDTEMQETLFECPSRNSSFPSSILFRTIILPRG